MIIICLQTHTYTHTKISFLCWQNTKRACNWDSISTLRNTQLSFPVTQRYPATLTFQMKKWTSQKSDGFFKVRWSDSRIKERNQLYYSLFYNEEIHLSFLLLLFQPYEVYPPPTSSSQLYEEKPNQDRILRHLGTKQHHWTVQGSFQEGRCAHICVTATCHQLLLTGKPRTGDALQVHQPPKAYQKTTLEKLPGAYPVTLT